MTTATFPYLGMPVEIPDLRCPVHPWESGLSLIRYGQPAVGDNGVSFRCSHRTLFRRRRCPWLGWMPLPVLDPPARTD